jgi:very-short-patch-repair endonuclease
MILSRRLLADEGCTDSDIRRRVRTGELVRVAAGLYAHTAELDGWPEVAYRVRVVAAAQRFQAIVSHASAAAIHGLPLSGADLSSVHLIRPGRGGYRAEGGRTRHAGLIDPRWVTSVDGIRVTTGARTVVDLSRSQALRIAVPAMDTALFRRLCTPEDVREALASVRRHRGAPHARLAAQLADGRAESPMETAVRLAARGRGLPLMELQFDVYDEIGRFVGRADGGYPELGVMWEYDGRGKYGELLSPGRTSSDALMAEKRRERGFVELGWTVIRIDNTDLSEVGGVVERLSRAVDAASRPQWNAPRGTFVLRPPLTIW